DVAPYFPDQIDLTPSDLSVVREGIRDPVFDDAVLVRTRKGVFDAQGSVRVETLPVEVQPAGTRFHQIVDTTQGARVNVALQPEATRSRRADDTVGGTGMTTEEVLTMVKALTGGRL